MMCSDYKKYSVAFKRFMRLMQSLTEESFLVIEVLQHKWRRHSMFTRKTVEAFT